MAIEHEVTTIQTWYSSLLRPEIRTTRQDLVPVIDWADARHHVWTMLSERSKSKVWTANSNEYTGNARDMSPDAILHRAERLKMHSEERDTIWGFRARFSVEHYQEKGFTGGFFQQWDGSYNRGCMMLDYTPRTRDNVVERFKAWCETGPHRFDTVAISIDGVVVFGEKVLPIKTADFMIGEDEDPELL
jgi:hypothetical protein